MNNFIITNKGYEQYSQTLTGSSLEFTKLCIGSGKEDGTHPTDEQIRGMTELYTSKLEIETIKTEKGVLVRRSIDAIISNVTELPESGNEGEYVYITSSKELYLYKGGWEKKTVNSNTAAEGEYFYDVASGKLGVYELNEAIITISASGNNVDVENVFYEKELGLYAKVEDREVLFAYAYIKSENANLITPAVDGVINLDYSIMFSVSGETNIEIINAGSGTVGIGVFNELSETVEEHIKKTDAIHKGIQEGLRVSSLESFDVGDIAIERHDMIPTQAANDENIMPGDTLLRIIQKLRRAISRVYNHKHSATDIEDTASYLRDLLVIGEYTGNGVATRKIELGFTPRMVEVYRAPCINNDYIDSYEGVAISGINGVCHGAAQKYINVYDAHYCTVSICENGFYVSETAISSSTVAHTNQLNIKYFYKATR